MPCDKQSGGAADGEPKKPCPCKASGRKIRPSELPIYGNPYPAPDVILNKETGQIEQGLRTARESLLPLWTSVKQAYGQSQHFVQTGIEHSRSAYDRISDPDGAAVDKAVAITAGGLLGVLLSARKGFFKKMLYTGTGVGIMSALCYPKQSTELLELGTFIARKKGPEIVKEYTGYDISGYVGSPVNGNGNGNGTGSTTKQQSPSAKSE